MSNSTHEIDSKIEHLHSIAKQLIKEGKDDAEIIDQLETKGVNRGYAELIVDNVHEENFKRREFSRHLILGLFTTIAGVVINLLSYKIAENTGSTMFLLLWGIVVAGIIILTRGFILYRK